MVRAINRPFWEMFETNEVVEVIDDSNFVGLIKKASSLELWLLLLKRSSVCAIDD